MAFSVPGDVMAKIVASLMKQKDILDKLAMSLVVGRSQGTEIPDSVLFGLLALEQETEELRDLLTAIVVEHRPAYSH